MKTFSIATAFRFAQESKNPTRSQSTRASLMDRRIFFQTKNWVENKRSRKRCVPFEERPVDSQEFPKFSSSSTSPPPTPNISGAFTESREVKMKTRVQRGTSRIASIILGFLFLSFFLFGRLSSSVSDISGISGISGISVVAGGHNPPHPPPTPRGHRTETLAGIPGIAALAAPSFRKSSFQKRKTRSVPLSFEESTTSISTNQHRNSSSTEKMSTPLKEATTRK